MAKAASHKTPPPCPTPTTLRPGLKRSGGVGVWEHPACGFPPNNDGMMLYVQTVPKGGMSFLPLPCRGQLSTGLQLSSLLIACCCKVYLPHLA